jgi:hypothetical protein
MPKPPSRSFPPGAIQASLQARQARADVRATRLAPFIAELRAAGVTTLKGIASALNERGVPHHRAMVGGALCRSRGY